MPAKNHYLDEPVDVCQHKAIQNINCTYGAAETQSVPQIDIKLRAGMHALIQAMPCAAVLVDCAGTIHLFNDKACERFLPDMDQKQRVEIRPFPGGSCGEEDGSEVDVDFGTGVFVSMYACLLSELDDDDQALVLLIEIVAKTSVNDARALPICPVRAVAPKVGSRPDLTLREEAARFKRLSETDPLTGAFNVRAFAARVTQALQDRPGRQGALMFLDLNNFKHVNDRYGHAAGDRVLTSVTDKLRFPPQTWIATARVGGDEFALWMPGVRKQNLIEVVAGIRARLAVPIRVQDVALNWSDVMVTAAIGVACCPEDASCYETLKRLADRRMYDDKARFCSMHI